MLWAAVDEYGYRGDGLLEADYMERKAAAFEKYFTYHRADA
jgi:hypothetical protein